MNYPILILLLITTTSTGYTQTDVNQSFRKAKIYLKNHQVFIVKDLKMSGLEASFLNSTNKSKETLSVKRINFVNVKNGSYLWDGALYGSLAMALSAVLIDVEDDPLTKPNKFGATEYFGFTLIGAGLGALVGSLCPKWKDVYSNGKFIGQDQVLKIDFGATTDLTMIKLTIPL